MPAATASAPLLLLLHNVPKELVPNRPKSTKAFNASVTQFGLDPDYDVELGDHSVIITFKVIDAMLQPRRGMVSAQAVFPFQSETKFVLFSATKATLHLPITALLRQQLISYEMADAIDLSVLTHKA